MQNTVHILNGDALYEQFPETIPGERIIFRECLVVGNILGESRDEFYTNRANFIASYTGNVSTQEYLNKTVPELNKIFSIDPQNTVHLWFERDLFCQVNLWYIIHSLVKSKFSNSIFLVLPTTDLEFGFGGMIESDMIIAFTSKIELSPEDLELFGSLWEYYKSGNQGEMIRVAIELKSKFDFIESVIKAGVENMNQPGRPKNSLKQIMNDLNTTEFEPVFKEFSKRESIYGFGDLQVKHLLDELKVES